MNNHGLPPPPTRLHPPSADAAPGPPSPYRSGGLVPPAGPARTWALTVIGVPLLPLLLLGLAGGSGATDTGAQAPSWVSPTTAYTEPATPDPYGIPETATTEAATPETFTTETFTTEAATGTTTPDPATSGTTETGDIGDVFGTSTDEPTATGTAAAGPEAVVSAYFAAINDRDYRTAWDLGGKNLETDYDSFVSGYATTQQDTISAVTVQGDVVRLVLDALETDGTSRSYNATYTVRDGEITHGTATQIN